MRAEIEQKIESGTLNPQEKDKYLLSKEDQISLKRRLGLILVENFNILTKIKKQALEQRIKKRLKNRLKQGMIEEVKNLHKKGVSFQRLEDFGLEYRYIAYYLQDKIKKEEAIEKLQKEIEKYAKRQMTWFKRDKRINWVKEEKVFKLVKQFLNKKTRLCV